MKQLTERQVTEQDLKLIFGLLVERELIETDGKGGYRAPLDWKERCARLPCTEKERNAAMLWCELVARMAAN